MSELTLAESVARFLLVDRAPATTTTYRQDLEGLARSIGADRPLAAITAQDIQAHFSHLRSRTTLYPDHPRRPSVHAPLSDATLTRKLKTICSFFHWCVRCGLLRACPSDGVALRRYERPLGTDRAISAEELAAMLAYARTKRCHALRDYAILLFLADTGCRVGGCRTLSLDTLDLPPGHCPPRRIDHRFRTPARSPRSAWFAS